MSDQTLGRIIGFGSILLGLLVLLAASYIMWGLFQGLY